MFRKNIILSLYLLTLEAAIEVHLDVFPAPREVETGGDVVVELEIGHAVDVFGGFFGDFFDFVYGFFVFDAILEVATEADFFAEVDPKIFASQI